MILYLFFKLFFFFFKILKFIVGLRMSVENEFMGVDYLEYMIGYDIMVM